MIMQTRRKMHGVTLMELMIVIVIIGILVAVGYPNYRDFAARAKRTEATSSLLEIASMQERFYLQNNVYTNDLTDLGFAANPTITDSDSYSIVITEADASDFTAVATYRLGGSEEAKCTTFVIDGRGQKTFTGSGTNCWTTGR